MMRPTLNCSVLALFAFALLSAVPVHSQAQFPDFPPNNVTSTMDRNQMVWQLGISFPTLPPKLEDPNRPLDAWPVDPANPEGNWTDAAGNTITRSDFGLWNNYHDDRAGSYTPIDLLKMKDGTPVKQPTQWWTQRRPEILKDVQEQVWGVMPPASV